MNKELQIMVIITDDSEIAETFNQYFSNIVRGIGFKATNALTHHTPKVEDSILNGIFTFQNDPSIKTTLNSCKKTYTH